MNIGLILPHLSIAQIKDEVVDIINKNSQQGKNSYSIFFENTSPNYRMVLAPLMNISDSKFFKGRLITFSLSTIQYALNSPNLVEPVLYVYDLEWLRGHTDFVKNVSIYRNPKLKIYTRSEDYADLLNKYANIKVEVKSLEKLMTENENVTTS